MTGTYIHRAPKKHHCALPGTDWALFKLNWDEPFPHDGDIWRCDECGQHWEYSRGLNLFGLGLLDWRRR